MYAIYQQRIILGINCISILVRAQGSVITIRVLLFIIIITSLANKMRLWCIVKVTWVIDCIVDCEFDMWPLYLGLDTCGGH